ncbi:uncharacterized protein LOC111085416 isoform X2 [Limulus polyphemus]|uniref:Uncharacterized protein LOC111085416 isoform X2 n=1 Tax=Limulus polyphemus TaxID=6850 RepID=A0ABM1S7G2_LIMPO|nr:uncharacterized protein LOC111085416 isoform X2 [Limulus polyphemus]
MKLSRKVWFFGELTYLLIFFCLYITRANSKEIEERRSCSGSEIRFRCDESIIAIHQAYFTTDVDSVNVTCAGETDQRTKCIEDIRLSINSRCSGITYCRYSYELDHMDKKCSGIGAVVIQFVCVYASDEMVQAWNRSDMESIIANFTNSYKVRENELDFKERLYIEEILIPSVLIIGLVLGNSIIIIIIVRLRRKNKKYENEEDRVLQPRTSTSPSEV